MNFLITISVICILIFVIYALVVMYYLYTNNNVFNNNVWIIYKKSGGLIGMVKKLVIYKNHDYIVYDHDKQIKQGILFKNIDNEINDILEQNNNTNINTHIMDGIYVKLIINEKNIPVDYNSFASRPKLIHILDELID